MRVKVQHVTQTSVCQSGAKDWNVVDGSPVQHGVRVIDFFAQPANDLRRRPRKLLREWICTIAHALCPHSVRCVLLIVHC